MPNRTFIQTVAAGVVAGVVVTIISRRFLKPQSETKGNLS